MEHKNAHESTREHTIAKESKRKRTSAHKSIEEQKTRVDPQHRPPTTQLLAHLISGAVYSLARISEVQRSLRLSIPDGITEGD